MSSFAVEKKASDRRVVAAGAGTGVSAVAGTERGFGLLVAAASRPGRERWRWRGVFSMGVTALGAATMTNLAIVPPGKESCSSFELTARRIWREDLVGWMDGSKGRTETVRFRGYKGYTDMRA